jgi:endoglucanase
MKKLLFAIVIAMITNLALAQEPATAFEMNERLGRGINMGNAFEAPTESAWGNPWQPHYFKLMSELGFSHVRIPIRWATSARSSETPPYIIDQTFVNRIQQVVDTALKYNLHPIINMHHHESLFEDPDGQKDRFLAQWEQIADFFKNYPDSLIFEVLNEPHNNLTPEKWNDFFEQALEIIRENNPTRVVLLGTAEYGGLAGVRHLQIPDDPYIILSVHYYNPFEFTHQGASWVGDGATAWLGTKWYDTEAERQTIINEFSYTKQFAGEHNIPVHVGEFGAYSNADMDSRVRWTTFLARWFEEQGFSWAYWEFSAGFGIYNPQAGEFLQPLVDALLHNPMPEPTAIVSTPVFEQDFQQSTAGWNVTLGGTGQAAMSDEQGNLIVNITNGGTESWHVQLSRPGILLEKGSMYKVTFRCKALESQRHLTSYVGRATNPWNDYSGYNLIAVSAQEQEYSYSFIMTDNTDENARLVFNLGMSFVGFSLSYVAVEKLTMVTSSGEIRSQEIKVFPNPAKENYRVENTIGFDSLYMYDIWGKRHQSHKLSGTDLEMNLEGLTSGLYMVTLESENDHSTFKVIKKK